MRMIENGHSLELYCYGNFILSCRLWSKLCKSSLLLHGHFQNMKQSSRYLSHDLIKSISILLPYIFMVISNWFSSKYAKVRVAYVGTILVPITVLECNFCCRIVPGCFSIQNEMACCPKSWGILLYRLVISTTTLSVLGSIFCAMEF